MPKLIDREPWERYDFRISEELLDKLTDHFELDKTQRTKAVHMAIDTIIQNGVLYSDVIYRYKYPIVNNNEPHPYQTYCRSNKSRDGSLPSKNILFYFREERVKINFLKYYYRTCKNVSTFFDQKFVETENNSKVIQYAIYDAIHMNYNPYRLRLKDHIVPYPGQKNGNILKAVLKTCHEIITKEQIQTYIEPFMGTANVYIHLVNGNPLKEDTLPIKKYFLNDLNYNMFCLVEAIRSNLTNFKTEYFNLGYSKAAFDKASSRYHESDEYKKKLSPLVCAMDIFYLLYYSFYSGSKTFQLPPLDANNEESRINMEKTYLTRPFFPLFSISCCLKKANLSCDDAFHFIEEHLSDEKALFYIDSPYFFSEDVYLNAGFDHKELAHLVDKIVASNHFFLLSNRVTVSTTRKKKHTRQEAIDMANKLYSMKNKPSNTWKCYYELHLFKKNKNYDAQQVEILISNYPFSGSKEYTDDITEAEVTEAMNMPLPK